METALYFPCIRVPESTWFTQILLCWDRAATIIPHEMQATRVRVRSHRELGLRTGGEHRLEPCHRCSTQAGLRDGTRAGGAGLRSALQRGPTGSDATLERSGRLAAPRRWSPEAEIAALVVGTDRSGLRVTGGGTEHDGAST